MLWKTIYEKTQEETNKILSAKGKGLISLEKDYRWRKKQDIAIKISYSQKDLNEFYEIQRDIEEDIRAWNQIVKFASEHGLTDPRLRIIGSTHAQ